MSKIICGLNVGIIAWCVASWLQVLIYNTIGCTYSAWNMFNLMVNFFA